MKASTIEYSDTQQFNSTVLRYLAQDVEVLNFAAYPPTMLGMERLLSTKKTSADRSALVAVLQEQYQHIQPSPEVAQNIALLEKENTFTITTGHQLNLFTGPLYFIYKIVSALALSKELQQAFPDKHFVPLYWMATEDHDFAEINHTTVQGKKIVWNNQAGGATGQLSTAGLAEALQAYQGILGISPEALQLANWVETAYSKHQNLADATRYLVNKLFEKYGLLVLDANHQKLKKQFSSIVEHDILEQQSFKLISETTKRMQKAGLSAPVNPREINFFYLKEGLRERIVREDQSYRVVNTDILFTEKELRTRIQNHPEEFSPNVAMRPLYQECILPNVAYIGGGAELSYWLELKSTFNHYHIDFPIVLLRNSAQLFSSNTSKKIKQLGLNPSEAFLELEQLKKNWLKKNSSHNLNLTTEEQAFAHVFSELKKRVGTIDQSLEASTEAIHARLKKATNTLEKKLIKAEKRNHAEAMHHLENIREAVFPNGILQERIENFGPYFALYGFEFIDTLLAHFKPLEKQFTLFELTQ